MTANEATTEVPLISFPSLE